MIPEGAQKEGNQHSATALEQLPQAATNSLPERISASAKGLMQETILKTSPVSAVPALASLSSTVEKGTATSSSTGSTYSGQTCSSRHTSISSDQSFRSDRHSYVCTADSDFQVFRQGSIGTEASITLHNASQPKDHSCSGNAIDDAASDSQASHSLFYHHICYPSDHARIGCNECFVDCHVGRTPTYAGTYDGSEVVALLSDPSFCPGEDSIEGIDLHASESQKHYADPLPAQSSRKKLPNNIISELQLVPGLGTSPTVLKQKAVAMPHVNGYAEDIDLQPWLDILNCYHEEVWGDMLPLVQEAREELKTGIDSEAVPQDKPAVRRLQMILSHIRER